RSLLDLGLFDLFAHERPFAASRSCTTVRIRAISRLVNFSRALFSSAPVTDWKRRLNSSCRRSISRCSSSSSLSSRSSLGLVKELSLPLHDLRLDRQLLRVRLVREDVDPDLAAALDLARHRDTGGLDLAIRDPAALDGLEAVVAELDRRLALRLARPAAAMDLAELRLLRHQHRLRLLRLAR